MGVRGILVSFDEDASPNGAEGFRSWLQGMVDFHLPNMSIALTITDDFSEFASFGPNPQKNLNDLVLAQRIWSQYKGKKIQAIKELRAQSTTPYLGLKEAKDLIDAMARRDP